MEVNRFALRLFVLGPPRVESGGRDLTAELAGKSLALLGHLALAPSAGLSRARLATLLWPEKSDEASRYRLRHALWDLRRALGKDCVESDGDGCALAGGAWVDARQFTGGLKSLGIGLQGHAPVLSAPAAEDRDAMADYSALVGLYRGDLLEGLTVHDAPLFDEWLLGERERFQLLFLSALWQLAKAEAAAGLLSAAAQSLDRYIAADPLRERGYRALMGIHLRLGDPAAALRVYRRCSVVLSAELGVRPSAATERLREKIAGGNEEPAEAAIARAAGLARAGRLREAWTLCAASERLAVDPIAASRLALMKAEIAIRLGQSNQVLSLIRDAGAILGRFRTNSAQRGRTRHLGGEGE